MGVRVIEGLLHVCELFLEIARVYARACVCVRASREKAGHHWRAQLDGWVAEVVDDGLQGEHAPYVKTFVYCMCIMRVPERFWA